MTSRALKLRVISYLPAISSVKHIHPPPVRKFTIQKRCKAHQVIYIAVLNEPIITYLNYHCTLFISHNKCKVKSTRMPPAVVIHLLTNHNKVGAASRKTEAIMLPATITYHTFHVNQTRFYHYTFYTNKTTLQYQESSGLLLSQQGNDYIYKYHHH